MKGWKKIFHADGNTHTKPLVATLISHKIDVKLKMVKTDKAGYYIMIRGGSIPQDYLIIVNI